MRRRTCRINSVRPKLQAEQKARGEAAEGRAQRAAPRRQIFPHSHKSFVLKINPLHLFLFSHMKICSESFSNGTATQGTSQTPGVLSRQDLGCVTALSHKPSHFTSSSITLTLPFWFTTPHHSTIPTSIFLEKPSKSFYDIKIITQTKHPLLASRDRQDKTSQAKVTGWSALHPHPLSAVLMSKVLCQRAQETFPSSWTDTRQRGHVWH